MNKQEARKEARRIRDSLSSEFRREAARKMVALAIESPFYQRARTVCLYRSIGSEADTEPLLQKILADGKRVVMPVTHRENRTLSLALVTKETVFTKGAYGIEEPAPVISVKEEEVDWILVPGLAFSQEGGRIGYGAGYYDRLLPKLSCPKTGICYACSVMTFSPEAHDVPMDTILTEEEEITCRRNHR